MVLGMSEIEEATLEEIRRIDVENEKIAVGHMLQDEQAAIVASRILQERYFVTPYAAFILKIVKSCIGKGENVTDIHFRVKSITSEDWKQLAPELNVTCHEYTRDCMIKASAFLGSDIVAEGIFKKVQDQYLRREGLALINESELKLINTTGTKDLREVMFEIGRKANDSVNDLVEDEKYQYSELGLKQLNEKEEAAICSGFSRLDDIIDGFKAGELITLGAGTGIGKSAFAINLALNITGQGHTVGLWSFEMNEKEIFERIFSNKTGLGKRTQRVEERYNRCREYLENTKDDIHIFTSPIKDLSNFYLQCRKLSIQKNMQVVIIDYLQLIHLNRDYGVNRVGEIEKITNTMKIMATELGITIIMLSQLSRAYQKREDKTPILADLRDSGSIEQDSNIVMFLTKLDIKPVDYREWESCIQLIVAKNRSGKCGSFKMKYNGSLTRFTEEGE